MNSLFKCCNSLLTLTAPITTAADVKFSFFLDLQGIIKADYFIWIICLPIVHLKYQVFFVS